MAHLARHYALVGVVGPIQLQVAPYVQHDGMDHSSPHREKKL